MCIAGTYKDAYSVAKQVYIICYIIIMLYDEYRMTLNFFTNTNFKNEQFYIF